MDTQYIRNILIVNNKQYGKSELIERLIEFCNRSMGYGEGIFNTVVTGPGKIYLQSMPINQMAGVLQPFLSTNK